ncbi:MAG TPA: hypothetical protein DIT04_00585 [Dysgonomonas sp.]|nr:hypothetical protein [Dysgonomonas sp.]
MKFQYALFILVMLVFISCSGNMNKPDNTKPMYGEVAKSPEYQKIDDEFKLMCLQKFGSLYDAALAHAGFAWDYVDKNDFKSAMKRFNQVWLLDPSLPDSYYGFAFIMKMQNKQTDYERFYKMALEKDVDGEGKKRYEDRVSSVSVINQ